MEGVVPGQMAPLQNRHRQYRPHIYPNRPNIKKKVIITTLKLTGVILQWGDLTCLRSCDSIDLSAKYCTYSLMDMQTQQIVSYVTINVTETGSSSTMEVE